MRPVPSSGWDNLGRVPADLLSLSSCAKAKDQPIRDLPPNRSITPILAPHNKCPYEHSLCPPSTSPAAPAPRPSGNSSTTAGMNSSPIHRHRNPPRRLPHPTQAARRETRCHRRRPHFRIEDHLERNDQDRHPPLQAPPHHQAQLRDLQGSRLHCCRAAPPTAHSRQFKARIPDSTADWRARLSRVTCLGSGLKAATAARSVDLTRCTASRS